MVIIQGKQRKPKWKAIAEQLLKAEGGVLKLKRLQSRALKSAQLSGNPSKAALKAEMLAKVCSPSKCPPTGCLGFMLVLRTPCIEHPYSHPTQ